MNILPLIQLRREEFESKTTSLRKPCAPVANYDIEFQSRLDDLVATFQSHKIAVGLAAPQVGWSVRVTVINISKGKTEPMLILVNPRILSSSRETESKYESCMSLPWFKGLVERADKIKLSYCDREGKEKTLSAKGFLARVIFHEIDHLDGILYIDRMPDLTKLEPAEFFAND